MSNCCHHLNINIKLKSLYCFVWIKEVTMKFLQIGLHFSPLNLSPCLSHCLNSQVQKDFKEGNIHKNSVSNVRKHPKKFFKSFNCQENLNVQDMMENRSRFHHVAG